LVTEVLRGAETAGAATQKLYLDRYVIAPCRSCGACVSSGRCIHRDGMDELLPMMEAHDVWVLGTPVYWWGPTAQMKLFVDRWFAPWASPATRGLFRNRLAVVVIPLGDSHEVVARHTAGMFADICTFLGVALSATIIAPGVGGSGIKAGADVLGRPELMQAAHDAGRSVVGEALSR